jgi:endonuclease YncB( thermonuclease family)
LTDKPVVPTYNRLRDQVGRIITSGGERAREAVEQEKVRTSWEVGQLLHEHLLEERERAEYGAQLLRRLADDLEVNVRRLYEMLELYRRFPMLRSSANLTYSHYVKLIAVGEGRAREFYADRAAAEHWSVRQLDEAIKAEAYEHAVGEAKAEEVQEPERSTFRPKRGRLYTYRLVQTSGGLRVDLGFGIHCAAVPEGLEMARAGGVVESVREGGQYRLAVDLSRRPKLFTYRATVTQIIDGDTVWAEIDCGFGVWTRQKLRLRGIDAPELETAAGWRARSFINEVLKPVDEVVVTTSRADKYDRYLADLYYLAGAAAPERVLAEGRCLNQELLVRGLAQEYES